MRLPLLSISLREKSDSLLLTELKNLVFEERRLTLEVLHYLREIEVRKIHLASGFSSLFEYCVKELGYSEGSAHRRLSAMRLMREIPEVEAQLKSGTLTLTAAAQAQSYFREAAKTRKPVRLAEKIQILKKIENLSTRECERTLLALNPNPILPAEKTRPLTEEHTLIQFVADRALFEKLERLKSLLAHKNFEGEYAKLFHQLADLGLKKFDPLLKQEKSVSKRDPPRSDRHPHSLLYYRPTSVTGDSSAESAYPLYSYFRPHPSLETRWRHMHLHEPENRKKMRQHARPPSGP